MPQSSSKIELKRRKRGQGLIEVCVGIIFLVIMALAILDLGVFVMGGDICGGVAKQAARAAGNATDQPTAAAAVTNVGTQFKASSMYKNLSLAMTRYDNSTNGIVSVVCTVTIVLPVAVPILGIGPEYQIKTQASEPIVGIAPANPT
ncbi:MAG TPA: hypothetical protein V6C97_02985 [Oculatellaceae cyanobacterium]